MPKMLLSGVRTRSGDLARFTFKGLDGTMTDLFIHLVAYQLVTLSGTFPCLTKARCRSSPFLVFSDTASECAQKTRKKAGGAPLRHFWRLVAPLLSAPKKREKRRGCPSSSFLKFSGTAFECAPKREKKAGGAPLHHFWCLVAPPKKHAKTWKNGLLPGSSD